MIEFDEDLIQTFEDQLNPTDPEGGAIPAQILGYGEISSVLQIDRFEAVAFKRMPPFPGPEDVAAYLDALSEYHRLLKEAGLKAADYRAVSLTNKDGEHIVYVAQQRLPGDSIGHKRLALSTEAEMAVMVEAVTAELIKVWRLNAERGPKELIGLDGQISNWAFTGPGQPTYLDTTTPFIRRDGKESLDPEVFLKSVPFFLVGLVRWAFLDEVLDRYYDLRLVLTDLIANFRKEGRPDLIDPALELVNRALDQDAPELKIAPLSRKEVDKYYRGDAFIWRVFLTCRRLDRFIRTRLLGQKYNFILPGKIER